MTIQERALNKKQFGSKFSAEWNNEEILCEVLTTLWRFCVFVTDSKIWQALNYYLKSTKTNRSAKVLFIQSSTASQMHSKHLKYAMQTFNQEKLPKQNCIKLTFILFEEVLNSTEFLLWVCGRSANDWFSPFKNFRCQTITNNLFFLLRSWFLRNSVHLKSKFTGYRLCPQWIFPELL